MREIKFRAWDYYEKKMYEVGGIDFFWGIIKLQWWHRTEDGMDRRKTKEMDMDIDKELHELFGVELMQFTGLYDKHHKPIYEGDIVESLTKINGYVCRGVVIFENGKFLVNVESAPFAREGFKSDFDLKIREYEVIGNIFQDGDLLRDS